MSLSGLHLTPLASPFKGTGSYPPLQNGLHLSILDTVNAVPTMAPLVLSASIEYSEQLGINLQHLGFSGEISFLYAFTSAMSRYFIFIFLNISPLPQGVFS